MKEGHSASGRDWSILDSVAVQVVKLGPEIILQAHAPEFVTDIQLEDMGLFVQILIAGDDRDRFQARGRIRAGEVAPGQAALGPFLELVFVS